MEAESLAVKTAGQDMQVPCSSVHSLVIGSGAAGLNAAVRLKAEGVEDVLVVTEGLKMGTSINTGSDKQTYYKLGVYGEDKDSPAHLARSFFDGGGMHGDLSLVEAALSPRAFFNLANLGVKFPTDSYGQFVGYKTDHDPLQRATSFGPYTSREMCRALIGELKRREIAVREQRVVVSLLVVEADGEKRACGCVLLNMEAGDADPGQAMEVVLAENVVFAVGGPGGLYRTSVYPMVHTGAIGLGLLAGARAQSLPESQYGMASIGFRWNVSGTYMQVLPRFISTDADGSSNEEEFLRPWFETEGDMNSAVFLKGYQWPFDPRKVVGGSSIVDILVYIETVLKGRRVFLDFRRNSSALDFDELSDEARTYLERSEALFGTPLERLRKMNPAAIELYHDHGIDIESDPLEIAVCAQHNNGGLAGTAWWESANIRHLFPVGEVNGSHGVYRPGGSALNSGQVAGFRAAAFIAGRYREATLDHDAALDVAAQAVADQVARLERGKASQLTWQSVREAFQMRMSKAGAHIRSQRVLEAAVAEAWTQWGELDQGGCCWETLSDAAEGLRNVQLCFAHAVYLEAVLAQVRSGVGSRGSALVADPGGTRAHERLDDDWCFAPEDPAYREQVLETEASPDGNVTNTWVPRRPIPECDAWFETTWAEFRSGEVFRK